MLVRSLLGAAAIAAGTGLASGQTPGMVHGSRPAHPAPAVSAYPAASMPAPEASSPSLRVRLASLLQPSADQPAPAQPAPVATNPAAPPGFNAPCPVYGCDNACEGIGAPGRFWARNEWLFWSTSGQPLPVLATGSPAGTDRSLAGVPGSPNTIAAYGGSRANQDFRNGYRLNAGWWLDDCRTCGIEGDFFFLGDSRQGFSAASNGSAIIARPFVNAITGLPDAQLVSFPGAVAGSLVADVRNSIIGGGVSAVKNICGTPCGRLDWLIGYRYWNVSDDVNITENLTALANQNRVPAGTTFVINDRFQTSNNFHGGLIGLSGERNFGNWFVGGQASVALGMNYQTIDISGSTTITPPGGTPVTYSGGLLAQPSNIGSYSRSTFAVVPEVGMRVGCQLTECARFYAGYNFLYMSNVVRAGDQIDLRVNPNQLPPANGQGGPALPAYNAKTTDFWAQGISLGIELRY